LIQVTKTFLPPISEYIEKVTEIWETNQLTNNGAQVRDLQRQLKSTLNLPNLELVSNGTIAIQLAIKALDLHGEIITTPYSYVATTNAILWENCTPVFVDIEDKTFCINSELIEASITSKTSGILATHVYGYPCNVKKIRAIAEKYNLKVIYDGAHAFSANYNGRSLIEYGDCTTLSFHATKLFHTGEGGGVASRDSAISKRIFLMAKFGHIGEEDYMDLGINAKMSEFHAAMGLCVLPYIKSIIQKRKEISLLYDSLLDGLSVQRPVSPDGHEYNYAYYPVVFSSTEVMLSVRRALTNLNIQPRRYFYPSLNRLPFLSTELQFPCPVSESIADRVLCLPLSDSIETSTIHTICECIKRL